MKARKLEQPALEDGFAVLLRELSLKEIAGLIERTARWVAPETFKLLPVWFPEYWRGARLHNAAWTEARSNTNRLTGQTVPKLEGNGYANLALCLALGIRKRDRPNWSCCHIWGRDDLTFQVNNTVVADPRFYSCVANMVLLPTPLKAFTDSMPEIRMMLRICATNLYGWRCDHDDLAANHEAIQAFTDWSAYPASWPRTRSGRRPPGLVPLNDVIRANAQKRLGRIRSDLKNAGPKYPRVSVLETMRHWSVGLE